MSKFDDVMRHLNPKVIIEKTEIPHDTIRAKYVLKSSIVSSYREYENIIIDYIAFHSKALNNYPFSPDICLHEADKYLKKLGGLEKACYIGTSGADGGMPYILNLLNDGFKATAREAYFRFILNSFVTPHNFDETIELMQGLKDKLSAYSPYSFQYFSAAAMTADYKSIIWNYIDSLAQYKNIWKFY
ncbi:MAG: hypothetical protein KAI43_05275 [Candidatus Aureabacteria bacterium]|nr:hypothetical protein [Candidatus Auribacterota bacterium]